ARESAAGETEPAGRGGRGRAGFRGIAGRARPPPDGPGGFSSPPKFFLNFPNMSPQIIIGSGFLAVKRTRQPDSDDRASPERRRRLGWGGRHGAQRGDRPGSDQDGAVDRRRGAVVRRRAARRALAGSGGIRRL